MSVRCEINFFECKTIIFHLFLDRHRQVLRELHGAAQRWVEERIGVGSPASGPGPQPPGQPRESRKNVRSGGRRQDRPQGGVDQEGALACEEGGYPIPPPPRRGEELER